MTHRAIIATAFQHFAAANCKTYGKTPEELRAMIPFWADMLKDLDATSLEAACAHCAKTCEDWPSVAEIRAAAEKVKADRRAELRASGEQGALEKRANPECEFCGGSGHEIRSSRPDSAMTTNWATRCRCLSHNYIAPPAKPRKLLTAAEAEEIAEVLKR